jgi:hypothetical protein
MRARLVSPSLLAVLLLFGARAAAEPDLSGMAMANNHGALDAPIRVQISRLPIGKSLNIDMGGPMGIGGIAKITAQATCPTGKPLLHTLEIVAPLGQYDGMPGQEYAGFCPEAPSGSSDYTPMLEFSPRGGGGARGKLHAKWRWAGNWPQSPTVDTSDYAP